MAKQKKKQNAWSAMASDLGKAAYGAYEALDDQLKRLPGLSTPKTKSVKPIPTPRHGPQLRAASRATRRRTKTVAQPVAKKITKKKLVKVRKGKVV